MKKNRLLLFFFFVGNYMLIAQPEKNVVHQSLFWARYYNQLDLNAKWSIHSEIDNRVFVKPIDHNLLLFRFQGRYKVSEKVALGCGFVYQLLSTQIPEFYIGFERPEYRGQQDITWKQSWGKLGMSERFQVEERFFHKFDDQHLVEGTNFNWRFRYRVQGDYILWKKDNKFLKSIIAEEIFINVGKRIVYNTFDQNLVYLGLQHQINTSFAIEMGYLNIIQQRATGIDYFNRNAIRLSIFHKLKI